MNYLLDTHTLLWLAFEDELVSPQVRQIVATPGVQVFVSAASAWEIATKFRIGKLNFARSLAENFIPRVTAVGYKLLSVTTEHAHRAGLLPGDHKDPFDRMIAAQAIHENFILLSNDVNLDKFAVRREW